MVEKVVSALIGGSLVAGVVKVGYDLYNMILPFALAAGSPTDGYDAVNYLTTIFGG